MAVKVFMVDKSWEADMRACIVRDRRDAQMVIYPVQQRWDAQTKLFLVPKPQDADLKVYVAKDIREE
ncbi:MAG: hypothetical protein FH749_07385 [Firmicutes bacterium]|nr:hypothetical protein [Bacillota bacterium]